MQVMLKRGLLTLETISLNWRAAVAAAAELGWDPGPEGGFPGENAAARVASVARVFNGVLTDEVARSLSAAVDEAHAQNLTVLVAHGLPSYPVRDKHATPGTMRYAVRDLHESLSSFLRAGSCSIQRFVNLTEWGGGGETYGLLDLDARSFCALQELAYGATGWLPRRATMPLWLSPNLVNPWESRHGPVSADGRVDFDVRFDTEDSLDALDADEAREWGDAVEAGLLDRSIVGLPTRSLDCVAGVDDLLATSREWFTGRDRLVAERFIRLARRHDGLNLYA